MQGKPIPTNQWWTDLLVATRSYLPAGAQEYVFQQDPYGGNLWFYPGMLSAGDQGRVCVDGTGSPGRLHRA